MFEKTKVTYLLFGISDFLKQQNTIRIVEVVVEDGTSVIDTIRNLSVKIERTRSLSFI